MAKPFFDSNMVIYAFADDLRATKAGDLLMGGGDISVQVLNEFTNIAWRKMGFTWDAIGSAIANIRTLVRAIHPIGFETHMTARAVAERYKLAFYDSVIVASALNARCDILYSEDMQAGLVIDGKLTIQNPFLS